MPEENLEASWKELRPVKRDKCLLDLPVLPDHRDEAAATDIVKEAYLQELNALGTPEELLDFVRRWRNLWLLRCPRREPEEVQPELQSLLALDFDPEKVFDWLQKKKQPNVPYTEDVNVRIMCHLALPIGLLEAFQLANHYQVGTDLGLVRLFLDGYPEHDQKLR
jgi:hypothetical protein